MSDDRLNSLLEAAARTDNLLILPHNDPDPDAIAGAVTLSYLLAEKLSIETTLAYHGIIGRAENKALVDYLDQPFQALVTVDAADLAHVALVDTQPGAGNNALPTESVATIVIDHHPWREASASARFADVRPELGASSTILTEYLQAAGLEPDRQLATALFYGIKTDTMGLSRTASPADSKAYFYLQPRTDVDALIEIERAQVPLDYFISFDTALRAARIYGEAIISYIGLMVYPDLAAEMADMLLRLEGSEWVICIGVYQDGLILAVRTRNYGGGAGQLAQAVVGNLGTAGGHGIMAGGQVPLNGREPKQLAHRLAQRALHHLNISPETKARRLV
ncbi:MAG: DHH family phosphoesterase [Anaerolineae bacterium]|nr:DHH family phosphoesterase [Anaerolineae bacterium]